MDSPPKKRTLFCIPLPSRIPRLPRRRKTTDEDIQLGRRVKPSPAVRELERELAEERTKYARLEEENRRLKAGRDEPVGTNKKLEDELRQVKELLEAREKDSANKDARLRQLENEIRSKVGRV